MAESEVMLPSPIAHGVTGYVICQAFDQRLSDEANEGADYQWPLLLAAAGLSLLPDVDSVFGIARDDMRGYHNNWTHSLVVGLGVASLVGGWAALRRHARFRTWFPFALACYESHVILDFFASPRGLMLLWPLTSRRFKHPVKLFYGMRWGTGITSKHHLVTVVTEIAFAMIVLLLLRFVRVSRCGTFAEQCPCVSVIITVFRWLLEVMNAIAYRALGRRIRYP